jgi:hypothetical protein
MQRAVGSLKPTFTVQTQGLDSDPAPLPLAEDQVSPIYDGR